jgi:hypothetical protein
MGFQVNGKKLSQALPLWVYALEAVILMQAKSIPSNPIISAAQGVRVQVLGFGEALLRNDAIKAFLTGRKAC